MLKNHKWYMEPRLVTVNDLYAFDPNAKVSIEPFEDIIGRHFKQPKEGLGYDNSSSAHMWRTLARPDNPLKTGGGSGPKGLAVDERLARACDCCTARGGRGFGRGRSGAGRQGADGQRPS